VTAARILVGDALARLQELPDGSVQTCITSPPYWGLRDYGNDGQLGLEPTPDEYVANMVAVFREVRRVLADDGTLWLNLGDSYAARIRQSGANHVGSITAGSAGVLTEYRRPLPVGLKEKDLVGIPWRVAFALQADGWWLRQDIIWHKPNPMPESVTDRCTKAHEYVFLLSKSARYFYDAAAIQESSVDPEGSAKRYAMPFFVGAKHESGGYSADGARHTAGMKAFSGTRNRRSVWTITTKPYTGAHFAVMPADLVEPCVLAGSKRGDTVLDPFTGSGTVGMVALRHDRKFVGVELNEAYAQLANTRIYEDGPLFNKVEVVA
jgi:DNA modification methylase